jgi:hypothetical protein
MRRRNSLTSACASVDLPQPPIVDRLPGPATAQEAEGDLDGNPADETVRFGQAVASKVHSAAVRVWANYQVIALSGRGRILADVAG